MNNLKKILPIILVLLMVLSWYVVLDEGISKTKSYNSNVEQAKAALKDHLPATAIESINAAMEIKPSPELVYLMADYYIDNNEHDNCIEWCENYLGNFKRETKLYEYLSQEYLTVGDYDKCIETIETAVSGELISERLKKCYSSVRVSYDSIADGFEYISTPKNGYVKFKRNDKYGIMDTAGNVVVNAVYQSVGGFGSVPDLGLLCAVVDSNGIAWLIDTSGNSRVNLNSKINSNVKYTNIGCPNEGFLAICDESGKYALIELNDYKIKISDAEFIGSCSSNRVAIKKNNVWSFVNNNGEPLSETPKTYDDIVVDDYGFAFTNEVSFVKSENGYIMINSNEEKITEQVFDKAKPFVEGSLASVCVKGKWGFVDSQGKVSSAKYLNTNSFVNGYGGFCKDGKWGFMNKQGKPVIKNEFEDSNGFISKSTAIIKYGDQWNIIKFYRSESLEKVFF